MAMSTETVVRRLIEEGFNAGDLAIADELTAPDLAEHQDFGPGHAPGAEGVRAVIASLKRAFSDFHLAIEDLVVDGDTAWLRMVATGTNDGSFMGHPPTGRPMRAQVFDVIRVRDGRMVEHWGVPDRLGVLMQLGLR
jgi:predicted ester cyclase